MRTLLRVLEQPPAAEALRHGSRRLTYEGLARRAAAFSAELQRRDLVDGHRVGVCLPAGLDLPPVLVGAWMTGAVVVPLDPADPRDGVRRGGVDLLVAAGAAGAALATGLGWERRTLLVNAPASWTGARLEGVFRRKTPLPDLRRWGHDEPCLLHLGPQGPGRIVSAEALDAFITAWREELVLGEKDRVAWSGRLPAAFRWLDLLAGLSAGATVLPVPPERLRAPAALAGWLAQKEITVWCSDPQRTVALLQGGLCDPEPPGDLRCLLCAGDPLPDADAQDLVRTLPWCRVFSAELTPDGVVGCELPDWFDPSEPPPRRPMPGLFDGAAPDRRGLRDTA